MSKSKNKDAEAYDREYDSFLKQLEEFHQQRGTPFKRLPRINGKGVDLYLLYVVVTARGGWQKVNSRNEWDEILEDFRLPAACVNSATALKHIYIRYLDAYERINYLGEDGDERNSEATFEDEDTRAMRARKNIRTLNNVPLSYNINQHNVQENQRSAYLLSTDLYKSTPYDKVALSLISPLPNEHDFAFNICTILSNEGRHAMQLAQYPRIVEFMLAHTGVFKDVETQKYFLSSYKEAKGKSLVQFWVDSVPDKKYLELLSAELKDKPSGESTLNSLNSNTDSNSKRDLSVSGEVEDGAKIDYEKLRTEHNNNCSKIKSIENSCESIESDISLDKRNRIESDNLITPKDSLKKDPEIQQLEKIFGRDGDFTFDPTSAELFQTGREIGTQDTEGTRIAQVLHIIRNLSFEEHNIATLAKSQTCLRFLVLCICSRWGGLAVNALDTLGNIAPEVKLEKPIKDPCSAMMLKTVSHGVSSPDRAMVLRSLEVLNKLAVNDPNEEVLNENIDAKVLSQIWNYLTIHDIMLLIYTLECLYSLSSLGSPLCNNIVHATGSIHTLISLLTVEAQSYGPEACIGMKVVETVTGVVSEPDTPPPAPLPASNNTTLLSIPPTVNTVPASATTQNAQHPFNAMVGGTPVLPKTPLAPKMPLSPKNIATPLMGTPNDPKKIAGRLVPPEVEEFVKQWVLQNYEGCPSNAIEQAIVYRHFAAAMHALGKKQGLNPVLLSNCVRKVFGTGVGPSRRPVGDGIEKWHYNGIRKKDGVVIPPMPDKKKPMVPLMGSNVGRVGMYSPTPVVASHNNMSQVNRNIQKQQLHQPDQDSNSDSLRKTATFNGVKEDSNSYLTSALNDKRVTSFEGILQNGIKSEDDLKDEKKNVLADLLEKTVGGEILNGVVEPDVRIGDKGLQFVKVNNQITTNGNSVSENIQGGIKRSATPDNSPAKRMALEVPQGTTNGNDSGRITLYVSQNGNESGEVISSGQQQQVILSQGQQGTVPGTVGQQVILSQGQQTGISTQPPTTQGQQQQIITSSSPQQVIVNSQGTVVSGQTMVTPQGQVILQRSPGSQTGGVIVQQGNQIITQSGAPGQVIQQVIQAGSGGQPQKVILHQGQLGQVLGGQVILSQNAGGQQVVLQGGNNLQGQVLVPGQVNNSNQLLVQASGTTTQGIGQQYIVSQGGGGGQTVVVSANSQVAASGQQVVSTPQGQTMIVTSGSQGQPMMVNTSQGGQSGQLVVSGNPSAGGQILLAPQQSGQAGKTLIILPNQHKMVLAGGGQQQGQQLVLPRQVGGQQVVQVVSAPSSTTHPSPTTPVRAIRAGVQQTPSSIESQRISSPPTSTTSHTSNVALSTNACHPGQVSLPTAIAPAPAGPTAVPVSQTTAPAPPTPHIPAPQVLSSGVAKRKSTGLQYLCEWRGCNQIFSSAAQVYHHACKIHCPIRLNEIQCQWAGCDTMTRKRFSAMTHLHDRHCNEQLLHILAVRRQQLSTLGKTDIPVPQAPPPHPGYAPNAAFHAIKRHALEVISQRDAVEKEGPVTKSIRLTSALILRNLVIFSNSGKKLLRGYESELANVALSGMESSRTVAQILYDIHLPDTAV